MPPALVVLMVYRLDLPKLSGDAVHQGRPMRAAHTRPEDRRADRQNGDTAPSSVLVGQSMEARLPQALSHLQHIVREGTLCPLRDHGKGEMEGATVAGSIKSF